MSLIDFILRRSLLNLVLIKRLELATNGRPSFSQLNFTNGRLLPLNLQWREMEEYRLPSCPFDTTKSCKKYLPEIKKRISQQALTQNYGAMKARWNYLLLYGHFLSPWDSPLDSLWCMKLSVKNKNHYQSNYAHVKLSLSEWEHKLSFEISKYILHVIWDQQQSITCSNRIKSTIPG